MLDKMGLRYEKEFMVIGFNSPTLYNTYEDLFVPRRTEKHM